MQTFPPPVRAYTHAERPRDADTGPARDEPVTSSGLRFLCWSLWAERGLVSLSAGLGLLGLLPGALSPWFLGKAVDEGILAHDLGAALGWAAGLTGLIVVGVLCNRAAQTSGVAQWLSVMYRTTGLVARKVAQMGHVITRRIPTGEMLAIATSDTDTFGMFAECVGRAIAALVSFVVVALMVLSVSPQLGVVVLVAAPAMVALASPLLAPQQRAQRVERERSSILTGQATDIVAGLRVLRGIGGERTFGENYARQSQRVRAAGVQAGVWFAAIDSVSVLMSGGLLVLLTWLGAHQMIDGRLSPGALISFFGYATFLVQPMQTVFELALKSVQALVAARKTIGLLRQTPPWREPADPMEVDAARADIVDERSGFEARAGELTVIVCEHPDESAALADRLGRYLPADTAPVHGLEEDNDLDGRQQIARARERRAAERAAISRRDEQVAEERWGVSLGGIDLSRIPLHVLRREVLVSDAAAQVFSGPLQGVLDPHALATREQVERALWAVSGYDILDALPQGWASRIDERGSGVSGGQRQRLVLARALLADPAVLVLVEPTSAVDAHTEARIAERLSEYRKGRTTVLTTVSPLWLRFADRVVWLHDGRVGAAGTHRELMEREPGYRAVVVRGEGS
ncbi:ABC-type multidrug transport system, ATPase and permease component [Propionibacterium cyclohexanicum]|uniref:ABC-type multidrug transport system, ATPase and permease component n=1 Tax=Propionibacterium cyclohexanicum TaxID=64702 RepID=A0A1H9SE50_9ACTN|nr:ABC transporter ATP-binding protein [Propionibacterium cyclohexanicum]SER83320.1 ABC-type multidrug transport system, ATPase and permease component [Propionibacterium cyclohexanicum]